MILTGKVWHKWSRPGVRTCVDKNGKYKTFSSKLRNGSNCCALNGLLLTVLTVIDLKMCARHVKAFSYSSL